MKHLIPLFLAICLLLASCTPQAAPADDTPTVMATFYPVYLAAQNLLKDTGIQLELLTQPEGGCLHDYQLTPGDLERLQAADLVLAVGGGMETFLSRITEAYPTLPLYECDQSVTLLNSHAAHAGHDHDGHDHGDVNAHYWVYVEHYRAMLLDILNELCLLYPAQSGQLNDNFKAYDDELYQLYLDMLSLQELPQRQIITFHEAFDYWQEPYGLEVVATIESEPGVDPSPGQLATVIDAVQTHDIAALFVEPYTTASAAHAIARETGAAVYILDPVASGPLDVPDYYQQAMRKNIETLQSALG